MKETKCKKQITCIVICFFFFLSHLNASGLHLYSYTNNDGQKIIVSDPDKIPVRYRHKLKKEFIGTYSPKQLKKKKTICRQKKQTQRKPPKSNITISIEPVIQVPDTSASASLWLTKLCSIQQSSERLQAIAFTMGRDTVEVRVRHAQNNKDIVATTVFNSLQWEGHENWTANANQLLQLMKNLHWKASQWMQSGNIGYIQSRVKLLRQARFELERLKSTFPRNEVKK